MRAAVGHGLDEALQRGEPDAGVQSFHVLVLLLLLLVLLAFHFFSTIVVVVFFFIFLFFPITLIFAYDFSRHTEVSGSKTGHLDGEQAHVVVVSTDGQLGGLQAADQLVPGSEQNSTLEQRSKTTTTTTGKLTLQRSLHSSDWNRPF